MPARTVREGAVDISDSDAAGGEGAQRLTIVGHRTRGHAHASVGAARCRVGDPFSITLADIRGTKDIEARPSADQRPGARVPRKGTSPPSPAGS
jgi:hypothetical protein